MLMIFVTGTPEIYVSQNTISGDLMRYRSHTLGNRQEARKRLAKYAISHVLSIVYGPYCWVRTNSSSWTGSCRSSLICFMQPVGMTALATYGVQPVAVPGEDDQDNNRVSTCHRVT